jgi:hypothetical protein
MHALVRLAAGIAPVCASLASAATNLVVNGDFERANPTNACQPLAWGIPDGLGVQWTNAPGGGHGMRFDTRQSEFDMVASWRRAGLTNEWNIPRPGIYPIAETYGLSFYSAVFPVVSGVSYRVSCDRLGAAGAKLWVKGYGMFEGRMTQRYQTAIKSNSRQDEWSRIEAVVHPTRQRPEVTEARVMLYAYHPPGVYWFDNVRVEPVEEAAAR